MPPRYARIASIEPTGDIAELVQSFNARIAELNDIFADLEKAEAITRGSGGQKTLYDSNIDASNFRVTNVATSVDPQDVVTRKELDALGLLPDTTGEMNIKVPVHFTQRVSTEAPTINDGNSFATISDVLYLIQQETPVATSRDGQPVTVEDATGIDGITEGTLAMARDAQSGKARMLKVIDDNLQVESPAMAALLEMLIRETQELRLAVCEVIQTVARNDRDDLPSFEDVTTIINSVVGANKIAAVDGQPVDTEDATGEDGTTDGILTMARDAQTGKARMLRVVDDNLQVESPTMATLLELLLEEMKGLRNELRD